MLAIRTASSSTIRCRAGYSLTHHVDLHDVPQSGPSRPTPSRRHISSSTDVAPARDGLVRTRKAKSPKSKAAMLKAQAFAKDLKKVSYAGTAENPLEPLAPPYARDSPPDISSDPDNPTEVSFTQYDGTIQGQLASILHNPPFQEELDDPDGDYTAEIGKRRKKSKAETYRKRYKEAFARVNGSFLASQLRDISTADSRTTKPILIQKLMARAGWPVPEAKAKVVEKAPTVTKVLKLPDNELYLLLQDTRLIHDLMINHGMTFSVVPVLDEHGVETDARALQAEGEERGLARLDSTLAKRVAHMTLLEVSSAELYGFSPTMGLLQFVSTLTGVYIDSPRADVTRITTMNPVKAALAQHLLRVAAFRTQSLAAARTHVVLGPPRSGQTAEIRMSQPDLFSVQPFFSSPSLLLPWEHLRTGYGEVLYRMRKVRDFQIRSQQETIHRDEMVEEGQVLMPGASKSYANVEEYLQSLGSTGERPVYTLTFGHLLLRQPEDNQGGLLSSPIPGQWPFLEAHNRLEGASSPVFAPSLTPSMMHYAMRKRPTRSRRLQYRSTDGKTRLTFTHIFNVEDAIPEVEARGKSEETENWLDKLDSMILEMEAEDRKREREALGLPADEADKVDEPVSDVQEKWSVEAAAEGAAPDPEVTEKAEEVLEESTAGGLFTADKSRVIETDIMMPDRPLDARLAIASGSSIAIDTLPETLTTFFEAVTKPVEEDAPKSKRITPQAPIIVDVEEEIYTLERDDEIDLVESQAPDENIFLRNVRVKDMILDVDRTSSHNELVYEGPTIPPRFWREMAKVARDVLPRAASLYQDRQYRL